MPLLPTARLDDEHQYYDLKTQYRRSTMRTVLVIGMLSIGLSSAHAAGTALAFRTPPGAVSIPLGQSKELGQVNVKKCKRIRIAADERAGSAGPIRIRVTITEGKELVAQLDTLTLPPHTQLTRVYEMPGRELTLFADAVSGGTGNSSVDVLIYGSVK
jgi:type III secretion protein HrpB1